MDRLEELINGYLLSLDRWERLEHLASIRNLLDDLAAKDDFGDGAVDSYAKVLRSS